MTDRPNNSKRSREQGKKLGRREIVKPQELLERYTDFREFSEHNWSRLGRALQRVQGPDDVEKLLRLIPGVEGYKPFRDQPASCLLAEGDIAIEKRALTYPKMAFYPGYREFPKSRFLGEMIDALEPYARSRTARGLSLD